MSDRPKTTYLILADAEPPGLGFRKYRKTWCRTVDTLVEAMRLAKMLDILDIHSVIHR